MARLTKSQREELISFIIHNVRKHPTEIAGRVVDAFGVSRETANQHLRRLVDEGILTASGKTKGRKHELAIQKQFSITVRADEHLEEHLIWRQVEKTLPNIPENVRDICQYGFTEMLNNVVSHSQSDRADIDVRTTAGDITISVQDVGIGIFRKIQRDFDLPDPRQALLELSKGKLTSDEARHTGEGIFFTSRMFDEFMISSGELVFCQFNKQDDWLLEVKDQPERKGTLIWMHVSMAASQLIADVFLKYAPEHADYGFTKTHVPIELAIYEGEKLMSRSQAKRLLSRVDKFAEVLLDFRGVATIGQPFADEIFRVFKNRHPGTDLIRINASPAVERMISHVKATEEFNRQATLFDETPVPEDSAN